MLRRLQSIFVFIIPTMSMLGCTVGKRTAYEPPPPIQINIPQRGPTADGSLWQPTDLATGSLMADTKARRVGDIVMINVVEDVAADLEKTLETGKESSVDAGFDTLNIPLPHWTPWGSEAIKLINPSSTTSSSPSPKVKATSKREEKNDGKVDEKGSVRTTITATVVEVLPNGNLLLQGSKQTSLNEDVQIITVTGIAAQRDITSANTIESNRLAETRLRISGSGPLNDAQRRTLLSRIYDWINLF